MKHEITFDTTQTHTSKPENVGLISKNLKTQIEVSIAEFASLVTQPNGYSFCPATFSGKRNNDNWIQQSMFCLDFDSGMTPEEGITCFKNLGINPNLVYTTFSDTPEFRKLRFCFFLDKKISNRDEFKFIQLNLMRVIDDKKKRSDAACKDYARMFFGGRHIELIDETENCYDKIIDVLNCVQLGSTSEGEINKKGISKFIFLTENPSETEKTQKWGEKPELYNNILYKSGKTPHFEGNQQTHVRPVDFWMTEHFNFKRAQEKIKIFNDFITGVWLPHPQLFGLATNLRHVEGGLKLMKETMTKFNDEGKTFYTQNNFSIIPYVSKMNYLPSNLESFSPYEEDHDHLNLISATHSKSGVITELEPPQPKISLEEAEQLLESSFKQVLESDDNNIYIFKVATGLGKTELLVKSQFNAVVGFPTHRLKDQVFERIQANPNKKNSISTVCEMPYITNEQVRNCAKSLVDSGIKGAGYNFLRQVSKNKAMIGNTRVTVPTETRTALEKFLSSINTAYKTKGNVATTHQRLMYGGFQHKTYIFDECPLSSMLSIDSIDQNDFSNVMLNINVEDEFKVSFKMVNSWYMNMSYGMLCAVPKFTLNQAELEKEIIKGSISSKLHKFLTSDFVVKPDYNNMSNATFITCHKFPPDKKIIILSATAPVEIYKLMYGDRVKVIEIDNIQTRGKQIQYTKYSYSRQSLSKHSEQIVKQVGDLPVITFAQFKELFNNPVGDMYFGNCSGYDHLKGKDMAVVGTPHVPQHVVMLYGMVLNVPFTSADCGLDNDEIDHNGYRFRFNAYMNPYLQKIQLALIESELIQAVGRNRILREDCTTYLFSNFPLKQTHHFVWD